MLLLSKISLTILNRLYNEHAVDILIMSPSTFLLCHLIMSPSYHVSIRVDEN